MINIAICDDEPHELERSKRMLEHYMHARLQHDIQASVFLTPTELMTSIEKKMRFDVILLDVYMPVLLGTEVANELRKVGDDCQIIFLTTSRDHAVDAFAVNATHYLIKPYTEEALFDALDKAVNQLTKKEMPFISLKTSDVYCRINLDQFVYAESDGHNQRIVLSDGKQITIRIKSTELFEKLKEMPNYYKCGSTYIINMDYIAAFSSKELVFSTGKNLPMISRLFTEFKKKYMDFCCHD